MDEAEECTVDRSPGQPQFAPSLPIQPALMRQQTASTERDRQRRTQQPVARLQEKRVLRICLLGYARNVLIRIQSGHCSSKSDSHVSRRPKLYPQCEVQLLRHIRALLRAGQVQEHARVRRRGVMIPCGSVILLRSSASALELSKTRRRTRSPTF